MFGNLKFYMKSNSLKLIRIKFFKLRDFQIKKFSSHPITVNFEKGSPYVKEITDKIYPKIPSGNVEKEINQIYADFVKANEFYSTKELNTAFTISNLVLNDALLAKDHILPLFVYNLLARILYDKKDINAAIDKYEKAETYYNDILKLKPEKYYLHNSSELEKLHDKNIDFKNNWNEIMDCIKNTLANSGILLWNVEEHEKSNEKLLHLLENYNLERDLLYFKVLHTIAYNYYDSDQSDLAISYCNKIIIEQNEIKYKTESNDELDIIVAKTHQMIASINLSKKEELNLLLPHYKAAELLFEKYREKEPDDYLNNLYCLALVLHNSKDFNSSVEYCQKLNSYLSQKNFHKSFDEQTLNLLQLKNYNMLVLNYQNLENLESSMNYLTEYLNLFMQIDFEAAIKQDLLENIKYLIYLYEKNFESVIDKEKMSKSINKCLSQFLNWKLIPNNNIEIKFYIDKLDTIFSFLHLKFQKDIFDSELVSSFEKVVKNISILSCSYEEEFKNLKLKIELIKVYLEMIKVILNQKNSFKQKLFLTLFENVDYLKDSKDLDWSKININNEINLKVFTDPKETILNLLQLFGDLLIVLEKNKQQVDTILPSVEKLITYVKDLFKEEKFEKVIQVEIENIFDELNSKYSYLKLKNNYNEFFQNIK